MAFTEGVLGFDIIVSNLLRLEWCTNCPGASPNCILAPSPPHSYQQRPFLQVPPVRPEPQQILDHMRPL